MDAMVTARIAPEKKARGNEVLASLGMTPSGIINNLYDFLIAKGQAPDLSLRAEGSAESPKRAVLYSEFLRDTVLAVPETFWNDLPEDDFALASALEEKYESLA